MINVLITGCSGYIATALIHSLQKKYNITAIGRKDFNLSDQTATDNWFKNKQFDVVLHTASILGGRFQDNNNNVLLTNLKMFFNLVKNKNKFKKFINFGSGIEKYPYESYYSLSKSIIKTFVERKQTFYNLRIYGIFDSNEMNTRFIKNNIINYINKQPIIINQNRYMDFIYMDDLTKLVEYCIDNTILKKTINCVYKEKYTLNNIANIINCLDTYTVPIILNKKGMNTKYIGTFNLPINPIGLKEGIKKTFMHLQSQHTSHII